MSKLGARPLNPVVEPPAPEPEPEETPEQAAESRQWDAELDGHLAHLRSLDPSSEHFAQDAIDAIDLIDHHTGGWEGGAELRARVKAGVAAKARADLQEHLRWAEETMPPGVDRTRAALHGFNLYLDQLDPETDAELIAFGRQALGIRDNPDSDE